MAAAIYGRFEHRAAAAQGTVGDDDTRATNSIVYDFMVIENPYRIRTGGAIDRNSQNAVAAFQVSRIICGDEFGVVELRNSVAWLPARLYFVNRNQGIVDAKSVHGFCARG